MEKDKGKQIMAPRGKTTRDPKKLQNRLEMELRQTVGLLDSLTTCVAKCDPHGAIITCNSAFLQATGLNREEVIFKKVYELPWLTHSKKELTRIDRKSVV